MFKGIKIAAPINSKIKFEFDGKNIIISANKEGFSYLRDLCNSMSIEGDKINHIHLDHTGELLTKDSLNAYIAILNL